MQTLETPPSHSAAAGSGEYPTLLFKLHSRTDAQPSPIEWKFDREAGQLVTGLMLSRLSDRGLYVSGTCYHPINSLCGKIEVTDASRAAACIIETLRMFELSHRLILGLCAPNPEKDGALEVCIFPEKTRWMQIEEFMPSEREEKELSDLTERMERTLITLRKSQE